MGFGSAQGVGGAAAATFERSFVRVGLAADIADFPNDAYTAISWTEEAEDTDGWHSNDTNPTRLTCPTGKGGLYLLEVALNWESNSNGYRGVQIRKNGTEVRKANQIAINAGFRFATAVTIRLAAGDYLEIYGVQNSGGTIDIFADAGDIDGETCVSLTRIAD